MSARVGENKRVPINAVIEAHHKDSAVHLRCDVLVERIASFEIESVARRIYLDDAPERFTVRALSVDGDKFSALGK